MSFPSIASTWRAEIKIFLFFTQWWHLVSQRLSIFPSPALLHGVTAVVKNWTLQPWNSLGAEPMNTHTSVTQLVALFPLCQPLYRPQLATGLMSSTWKLFCLQFELKTDNIELKVDYFPKPEQHILVLWHSDILLQAYCFDFI